MSDKDGMELQTHNERSNLTFSYLALRKAVGWIGILLPFVMMLGGYLIFKEDFTLVFWAETATLIAFGVSWLTNGGTLYRDKMVNYDPAELNEVQQHKTVTNES